MDEESIEREVGVGPHPLPWPEGPRFDPELLRDGDRRNVLDQYRYWTNEAIVADLDTNKDGAISRAELDASVDRLIAAADADRDGGVTLDEAKSYRLAKLRKPATPTGEQAN